MKFPEHEKLKAVSAESQKTGAFLDWLQSHYAEATRELPRINQLLAEYYEIDENQLELEKRAMLNEMRESNM